MRTGKLGVLAVAIAVGAVACSSLRVQTSHDQTIDLSRYATFTVLPSTEVKRADVRDFLAGTIAVQLAGRGLQPVSRGADLLVSYHVGLTGSKADTSALGYTWNDGWSVFYGTSVPFGSTYSGRPLTPGLVIVDLVDAKEMKLVWQGVASDTLDPQAPTDEISYRVTKALKKMFSTYPRKK